MESKFAAAADELAGISPSSGDESANRTAQVVDETPAQRSKFADAADDLAGNGASTAKVSKFADAADSLSTNKEMAYSVAQQKAEKTDPEQTVAAIKISNMSNIPVEYVQSNFENMSRQNNNIDLQYSVVNEKSPKLIGWASDPINASIAKDDINNLSRIERETGRIAAYDDEPDYWEDKASAAAGGFEQLYVGSLWTALQSGKFDAEGEIWASETIARLNRKAQERADAAPKSTKRLNEMFAKESKDVSRAFRYFSEDIDNFNSDEILDGVIDLVDSGAELGSEALDVIIGLATNPEATFRTGIESAAFSLPSILLGGAAGLAGGPLAVATVPLAAFGGSVLAEHGAWMNQSAGEQFDNTSAESVLAAIRDKAWNDNASAEALRKGVVTGGVDALLSVIGGRGVSKAIRKAGTKAAKTTAKKTVKETVKGLVSDGVTVAKSFGKEQVEQAVGEGIGEGAGVFAATGEVDIAGAILEGAAGVGPGTVRTVIGTSVRQIKGAKDKIQATRKHNVAQQKAIMGNGLAGLRGGIITNVTLNVLETSRDFKNAKVSIQELGAVNELSKVATESKTQTRDKDRFSKLVKDGDKKVYFQKDELEELFERLDKSTVEELEKMLGGDTGTYAQSGATGGPIEIPLEDLIARYGDTDEFQELFEIMRTKPDGMTISEARTVIASAPTVAVQIAEEAKVIRAEKQKVADKTKLMADGFEKQVVAAGQDKLAALPLIHFFKTIGSRLGVDPATLAARYNVSIKKVDASTEKAMFGVASVVRKKVGIIKGVKRFVSPNAQMSVSKNKNINIDLFHNANASSLIHELGHSFLEIIKDVQGLDTLPQEMADDFQAIMDWLGVKPGEEITTEHHEKFARGFEKYLATAKAPSKELKTAFGAFRMWMSSIYRSLRDLNVDLSDDIVDVFDRMLATDVAIEKAQFEIKDTPIFNNAAEAGMTPPQYERYIESYTQTSMHAREQMDKRSMRHAQRKKSKQYKLARRKVKDSVTKEVNDMPVYMAIFSIRDNKHPDGSPIEGDSGNFKINTKELSERYPDAASSGRFKGMTTTSDGIPLNAIAAMQGYDSTDALIEDISKSIPHKKAIEMITNLRMDELSPDVLNAPDISAQADKEIHNEDRSKRLKIEMDHLYNKYQRVFKEQRIRGSQKPKATKEIKEYAQTMIRGLKISEIKPNKYKIEERRFSALSAELFASGDHKAAWEAKQKEAYNNQLYIFATEAKAILEKKSKDFKKIFRTDKELTKTREIDLINAARAILTKYGFGQGEYAKAISYIAPMEAYNPDGYKYMSNVIGTIIDVNVNAKDTGDLKFHEFFDMAESIDALWDMAGSAKNIEIKNEKIATEDAVDNLVGQIEPVFLSKKGAAKYASTATKWAMRWTGIMGAVAQLRRIDHVSDLFDLGDHNGFFGKYIRRPVRQAYAEYREFNAKHNEKLKAISDPILSGIDTKKEIESTDLKFNFKNKREVLGALLHSGNPSSFRKLLEGREWGTVDSEGRLDSSRWEAFIEDMIERKILTTADFKWAEAYWKLNKELVPMANKAHKKVYGYHFNELTSHKLVNSLGTFEGGYVPSNVDVNDTSYHRNADEQKELEQFSRDHQPSASPADGGGGWGKHRSQEDVKPLSLDISLLAKHSEEIIRFSFVKPVVIDAMKVVSNNRFAKMMRQIDSSLIEKVIKPSLERTDKGAMSSLELSGSSMTRQISQHLTSVAAKNILFMSAANIIEQPVSLLLVSNTVSPALITKHMAQFLAHPIASRENALRSSAIMRIRMDNNIHGLEQVTKRLLRSQSKAGEYAEWAADNALYLQHATQNMTDIIAFNAAYEQSYNEHGDHDLAVVAGEETVVLTQGGIEPGDISNVQAQFYIRFFNMFMGFFNNLANRTGTEMAKRAYMETSNFKKYGKMGGIVVVNYFLMGFIGEALRAVVSGKGIDRDEDGEYWDDLLGMFGMGFVGMVAGSFPVGGTAVRAVAMGKLGDSSYFSGRMSVSPALTLIKDSGDFLVEAMKLGNAFALGTEDEWMDYKAQIKKKDVKDMLSFASLFVGLPLPYAVKPGGYIKGVAEGNIEPKGPVDFIRGAVTGKDSK